MSGYCFFELFNTLVYSISFKHIVFKNSVSPASELNASFGFHSETYRYDHIKIVMLSLVNFAIRSSCRKFCDNWNIVQFFFKGIVNMFAYCFDVTIKKFGKLRTIKPDIITL